MARTKSGVLFLTREERECLKVVQRHTLLNISWGESGSFTKSDGSGDVDPKEMKRGRVGVELIDFILKITE
jgi:hypothetical protein